MDQNLELYEVQIAVMGICLLAETLHIVEQFHGGHVEFIEFLLKAPRHLLGVGNDTFQFLDSVVIALHGALEVIGVHAIRAIAGIRVSAQNIEAL